MRLRSVIKGHRNNFKRKLQEYVNNAHVIDESEAIYLGDLSCIQGAHVAAIELENGRAISHSRLD